MERMPIYQRWIFNKYSHAGPLFYAVLIHLSMSYPPLIGKLHTRYSPVRRSPAIVGKPTIPLPLDLHVLSLSLAFILSQDQTLRCYKLFMSYAQDSVTFRFIKYWRYLFSKYLYYLLIYVIFSKNLVAIVIFDCGCKGKNFYFNLPNFFGSFFVFFLQLSEFRLDLPTSPISDRITSLYLFIMLTTASLSIAGAKVERIFESAKYFWKNFWIIFKFGWVSEE